MIRGGAATRLSPRAKPPVLLQPMAIDRGFLCFLVSACGLTGLSAAVVAAPAAKVRPDAVTLSGPTIPGAFCSSAEVAVFHCAVRGGKQVSVCASRTATPRSGALQYRFGRPGTVPEITLPGKATAPEDSATADTLMFSGGGGAWLRFRSRDHAYTVFTAIGRWGAGGAPAEREGVVVDRGGRRVAFLPCSRPAESLLGPELYGTLGLRPAAPDEAFEVPE